jgi:hypothetical protein
MDRRTRTRSIRRSTDTKRLNRRDQGRGSCRRRFHQRRGSSQSWGPIPRFRLLIKSGYLAITIRSFLMIAQAVLGSQPCTLGRPSLSKPDDIKTGRHVDMVALWRPIPRRLTYPRCRKVQAVEAAIMTGRQLIQFLGLGIEFREDGQRPVLVENISYESCKKGGLSLLEYHRPEAVAGRPRREKGHVCPRL